MTPLKVILLLDHCGSKHKSCDRVTAIMGTFPVMHVSARANHCWVKNKF